MNQLAPHSLEAERLILGQAMVDNKVIDQISQYIPEEQVFYNLGHQDIWKCILSLHRDGATVIDPVTIMTQMPKKTNLESPSYYLTGLMDEVHTTGNAEHYAKLVYEKWLLRKVIQKSKKIEKVMDLDGDGAYQALQRLNREVEDILNLRIRQDFDLNNLVEDTVKHMTVTDNIIPFGYKPLDDLTGGMTKGEITVVAGRPGHFKSTMTINVVSNLLNRGLNVLVFNREMSNVEMMKKLMIIESQTLSYHTMRMGNFSKKDKEELDKSKNKITEKYKSLIMYDDVFDIDRAMREIRKHRPDVVVDDYIGLIDVIGVDDNRLRIDNIMKQYKRAAKTYDMAAVLVSQLNRACEDRSNKRPILRDLRDSGSIEQDAEMILFMYYDWRYNYQDSLIGEHGIEVVLGKNRYGKTGSKVLGVVGDRCKILNSAEDAMIEMKRLKKDKSNGS
jgi:replicative DNA helicase|tara:strand:- start:1591 stop:2928 length:1338 start_codon:yes stop_codon:yes gene_type:complete